MMPNARLSRRGTAGHTLLEMMLSMTLLSIVMASVGSAVMFAAQVVPDEQDADGSLMADYAVLSQIHEDLATALYVIEQDEHEITIVTPDRTGDNIPDRIRYAWSGTAGQPLQYELNGGDAVTLIDAVAVFDLSYVTASAKVSLPRAMYLGEQTQMNAYEDRTSSTAEVEVSSTDAFGQVITPSLAGGVLGFVPTRLDLVVGRSSTKDGQTKIALSDWTNAAVGAAPYATTTLFESVLADSGTNWHTLTLDGGAVVAAGQALAVTAEHTAGTGGAARLLSASLGAGRLTRTAGTAWAMDSAATLVYRLHGRSLLNDAAGYDVTRSHLTRIDVSLQRVTPQRSPVQRRVRLMSAPPVLTGFAHSDFTASPIGVDLDADGSSDWTHSASTFPAASIQNGRWVADGELTYDDKSLLSAEVVRIRARMLATGTKGPTIHGPATFNERDEWLPVAVQLRTDGAGGQELVVYNDAQLENEWLVFKGLSDGLVDVELTLLPGRDLLSVRIDYEEVGAFRLKRVANPGSVTPGIRLGSAGTGGAFDAVDIAVGGSVEARAKTLVFGSIVINRLWINAR